MRFPRPTSSAIMLKAAGLMNNGPDFADFYRQASTYVGRLLKGARPSDLPVVQPAKLELTPLSELHAPRNLLPLTSLNWQQ